MADHWEILDIYKALLSLGAGIILGFEREMKDKVAGLKTITIICLGATLFAILSYKTSSGNNPHIIAAYVVSGVGFLGAGAIFKDGFSVSGLTTAGIIWLAAAVGLAIGFSEFYLAATFIGCWILMVLITPSINRLYTSKKLTRQLIITLRKQDISAKDDIIREFRDEGIIPEEKKITVKGDEAEIAIELMLPGKKLQWIQDYLLAHPRVSAFSF
jgi:putative Mg2+ transporter-C (MgtC) family protein